MTKGLLSTISKKTFLTCIHSDFNARLARWCVNGKWSHESLQIESLTSYHGLNEPTDILSNSSSCIDFIFTSQPNLITNSGFHSSLHKYCHHQITFAKFDLLIKYPPRCGTIRKSTHFLVSMKLTGKSIGKWILWHWHW